MRAIITPRRFSGTLRAPASKSHTIRRLLIAALSEGVSEILRPLDSLDARSCLSVCRALGAEIRETRRLDRESPNPPDGEGRKLVAWTVRGIGGPEGFARPEVPLNAGNSGTTFYFALALAALSFAPLTLDGDEQIRRRSAGPLLDALTGLGAEVEAAGGFAPVTIRGPWRGGRVSLPCPTSQYLSAILLAAPLAPAGTLTEIEVPFLNERPYIDLTLSCLDAQGIICERTADYSFFRIPGGQAWRPLKGPVAADFSSAAFPACAAVAGGGPLTILGLDPEDPQGDKILFEYLAAMGARVIWEKTGGEWALTVSAPEPLRGAVLDLNGAPDLLPALAVIAAWAEGETALVNAASARIKETDRIAVMAAELSRLGLNIRERPDGLLIRRPSGGPLHGDPPLNGGRVSGRGDHRVVMALAAGALGAAAPVEIDSAESAAVTWPGFLEILGAEFKAD